MDNLQKLTNVLSGGTIGTAHNILKKVAMGVAQTSHGVPKIVRAPIYQGALRGHLCYSTGILLYMTVYVKIFIHQHRQTEAKEKQNKYKE